jgi:hypothetical protein
MDSTSLVTTQTAPATNVQTAVSSPVDINTIMSPPNRRIAHVLRNVLGGELPPDPLVVAHLRDLPLLALEGKSGPPARAARPKFGFQLLENIANPAGLGAPVAVFFARMFDLVKPQIATAADKLTHLRRFL